MKMIMKIASIAVLGAMGSSVRADAGGIRSVESGGDEKGYSVSLNYPMLNYQIQMRYAYSKTHTPPTIHLVRFTA